MTPTNLGNRSLVNRLAAPIFLILLCWIYILTGAGTGMNIWMMTSLRFPPLTAMQATPQIWSVDYAVRMIIMWWVMMIAMMLPSVMNRVEKFSNSRDINPFGFLGGYVLAWLAFSVVATGIQYFAGQVGWLHPVQMWSTNKGFSVILLMSASVFQFLPIKSTEYCVQKKETQFTKGLRYGANCVATMAPMMLVLFVGGVMNLYWIIGLTIIAIVEKTLCNKIVFRRIGALFALLAFIALIS